MIAALIFIYTGKPENTETRGTETETLSETLTKSCCEPEPGGFFFFWMRFEHLPSQWCDGKVMTGLSSLRHLHDVIACGLYAVSALRKLCWHTQLKCRVGNSDHVSSAFINKL